MREWMWSEKLTKENASGLRFNPNTMRLHELEAWIRVRRNTDTSQVKAYDAVIDTFRHAQRSEYGPIIPYPLLDPSEEEMESQNASIQQALLELSKEGFPSAPHASLGPFSPVPIGYFVMLVHKILRLDTTTGRALFVPTWKPILSGVEVRFRNFPDFSATRHIHTARQFIEALEEMTYRQIDEVDIFNSFILAINAESVRCLVANLRTVLETGRCELEVECVDERACKVVDNDLLTMVHFLSRFGDQTIDAQLASDRTKLVVSTTLT